MRRDKGFGRAHDCLYARVVPADDLMVFIALVRPDNHAVHIFAADFEHFLPAFGIDKLFEIRTVARGIILRPEVADDFFVGIALSNLGNGGLDVFFPLRQIGRGDVEHGIGIVADGCAHLTAFAELPPFCQHCLVVRLSLVVADGVQVFVGQAVVADVGTGIFFFENPVHTGKVGFKFLRREDLSVFFGKPGFDVGGDGAVAFAIGLARQFADSFFVQYAVFALAGRIGHYQLGFVNQEYFGQFVGGQVGFADVVHAVVNDKVFAGGKRGGYGKEE